MSEPTATPIVPRRLTPGTNPAQPIGPNTKGVLPEELLPDIELPTVKTQPRVGMDAFTYYLYGWQKTGKTSLTSLFKDCCHIFYEPSGEDYELYSYEPTTWNHFKAFILKCEKEKAAGTLKYKNFAIDIVDLCYYQCLKAVCAGKGLDYPPEKDFGKTWSQINEEFRNWIHRLSRIGGVFFISHAKEKEIERAGGEKYSAITPTCMEGCHKVLSKFCTVTAYYHIDKEGKRWLGISPNMVFEAGNRLRNHFKYKDTGRKMDLIPMGADEHEAYNNFSRAFNNEFPDTTEVISQNSGNSEPAQAGKPALTIRRTK